MSTTVHAPEVPGTGRALAAWWRRAWIWFVLAALLVLVTLPALLRQPAEGGPLAPDSAAPQGSQAVVRVLGDHGITVHPATSLDEALALAAAHPRAPLLLHDPRGLLPAAGLDRLADAVAPERRVLVEPGFDELRHLAPTVSQAGQVPDGGPLGPGDACRSTMAREAATIPTGGRSYRDGEAEACFPVPGTDAGPAGAAHTLLQTADGTLVVGHREVFTNEGASDDGHPVLSLWSLGRSADVVWYLPGLEDVAVDPGPPTPEQLLPDWVRPTGLWLIVCLGLLMLWRGRRHGALAVEPLPVVVPASETAVGRARLYERFGHHAAAARSLRSATLVRLARSLRLGHGASAAAVVAAVAHATGQDPARVATDLDVETVSTSRDLVAAGRRLLALEESVTAALTTDPTPHASTTDPDPDPDGRTP